MHYLLIANTNLDIKYKIFTNNGFYYIIGYISKKWILILNCLDKNFYLLEYCKNKLFYIYALICLLGY